MDLSQLNSELHSGKIRGIYLLEGEEEYLVATARRLILAAAGKEKRIEPDGFTAGKTATAHILDALTTPSLLGPRRVVIVEETEKWKKEDWEQVAAAAGKLPEKAILILKGKGIRSKGPDKISGNFLRLSFKKMYPNQVLSWLNFESRLSNTQISREAADLLVKSVGTDLGPLSQMLQKLALFVGEKRLIRPEDVEACVTHTAQQNIFEFTKALGGREKERALKLLAGLTRDEVPPLQILGMVARHFRILARAQSLLAARPGISPPELARELGVSPYFVKDYIGPARKYRASDWPYCFRKLSEADRRLKSSRVPKELILEQLAGTLCHL